MPIRGWRAVQCQMPGANSCTGRQPILRVVDVDQVKGRMRAVWGLGDYSQVASMLEPAADALCEACAVSAGQEVLDVAAGSGNFALAAAREGAAVVASDLSPGMVELGRSRSQAEGYEIEWLEADAEELPFEDGRFDCVASVFGAMLAPRPQRAAGELFRVARAGGTVGMTAWTPASFASELFSVTRRYVPAPADLPLSQEWGEEATVRERFDGLAASIEFRRMSLPWAAGSPEELLRRMDDAGPQVAARENLSPEQYERLRAEALELTERRNAADDGSMRVESEYLQTVARKRG